MIVDGMCLAAALLKTSQPLALMEELIDVSALVQPILILSLLVLAAEAGRPGERLVSAAARTGTSTSW